MTLVRLGFVQYLNTLPLVEGLRSWKDAELVAAVPSTLIGLLLSNRVDVALASIIDAAMHVAQATEAKQGVMILPIGMIGCDGQTLTVRLFSAVPIERITHVHADTDSHTSIALLRILINRQFGKTIEIIDYDAREHMALNGATIAPKSSDWPEAVLLIGDKVVTDAPQAKQYPHQLDLGTAWKELTGLPFVYAAWMCRAGEEDSVTVRVAGAMLDRQRRHNRTRLDWIVNTRASERHWPEALAREYVGERLRYDIGPREREAVELFIRWSAELGLCKSAAVRWSNLLATGP